MENRLKRLTLIVPRELEEAVVAVLLETDPPLPGFTTAEVAGHGEGFARARVHERVRGRIDRSLLWMVLPATEVERVLEGLSRRLAHTDIVWWIEPVDAMGRFA